CRFRQSKARDTWNAAVSTKRDEEGRNVAVAVYRNQRESRRRRCVLRPQRLFPLFSFCSLLSLHFVPLLCQIHS
ncbi:unnamed protein product, partial [Linum tenue]